MITRPILFLARRVLERVRRCDATPSLWRAAGHLLLAFPGAVIIATFSLLMPSLRPKLDQQARELNNQPSTLNPQPS